MVAKAKEIDGFDKDTILSDLENEKRSDVRILLIIVDFLYTQCILDIVKELEADFKTKGNRHYPRLLLLGVLLYCFSRKIYKYEDIIRQCKENRFLRLFTRGVEPCESTFRNFLNENKSDQFRKIFLYTLLRFNEYDLLKFLHYFADSTPAIVRGSKFYKIYRIEIEGLKFMKKHNILHNGKKKSMNRSINKLYQLRQENIKNEKTVELIDVILTRIQIYNHRIYRKIDEFEEALNNSNKDFVCITYPNAPLIPLKSKKWDIAKNLQMAVSDNNTILGSIFINDPDDSHALEKLIPELEKNFTMLADLVEKYGTRNNTTEIKKLIKQAMIICDSGYDKEANIVYLDEHDLRSLIMPNISSRTINYQMRKHDKQKEIMSQEIINHDLENPFTEEIQDKRDLKIIWNGYSCNHGGSILCWEVTAIEKEIAKGLPEKATKFLFKYKCDNTNCPYRESCKYKSFSEKIKRYSFESRNKFTQNLYKDLYMQRFQKAESVFGYFEGIIGVLYLMGNNDLAISNEMDLRSTIYNMIHFVEIKGTFC